MQIFAFVNFIVRLNAIDTTHIEKHGIEKRKEEESDNHEKAQTPI